MKNEPTVQQLRELDAWIAEHVMGWVPHWRNTAFYVKRKDRNQMLCGNEIKADVGKWHPTINPADAMDVLKKCAEKGATVEVFKSALDGNWCVSRVEIEGVCF